MGNTTYNTLPYGHDKCLTHTCPACPETIAETPSRTNITMREGKKESSKTSTLSSQCEKASPIMFRSECDASFCHECSKSSQGSPTALRSHSVVSFDQKLSMSSSKCPRHPTKPLEHCCTKAQAVLDEPVTEFSLSTSTSQVSGVSEEVDNGVPELITNTQLSLTINVGVIWFAANWPLHTPQFQLINIVSSLNDLQPFDVIVVECFECPCPGELLDQFLNQGKGVVLFNGRPSYVKNFTSSCFDGSQQFVASIHQEMFKTVPNDPIFTNVNSFSTNCFFTQQKSASGTLLATVNNGSPLIAKKEVGGGRLVEFGCFPVSNDINRIGVNWSSSTDGHKLFSNAVMWAGKYI
ncbi:hypothetical protein GEMRC1_014117 [Eukaryota sp. GEM-RC1]